MLTRTTEPEESAVTTRFYSGGSQSMRGFSFRRMSPMMLIPTPGSDDPNAKLSLPIGGNGLIEGSFEVRSRFTESVVLATFLDFGTVTPERLPFHNCRVC